MHPGSLNQANVYRLGVLLGVLIISVNTSTMYSPDIFSSAHVYPLLLLLALVSSSLLAGSLFLPILEKQLGLVALLCTCMAVVYLITLLVEVNLNRVAEQDAYLTVALAALLFDKYKLLIGWLLFSVGTYSAGAYYLAAPEADQFQFVQSLILIALITGILKAHIIRHSRELATSQALLSGVFEKSSDGLIYGNVETDETYGVNHSMKVLMGTDDPEQITNLIYDNLMDTLPANHPARETIWTLDKHTWSGPIVNAKGEKFWASFALSHLEQTESKQVMVRVTDITEWHKQQLATEAAKDTAEKALEVRSRFLANMSHEIRTPMNGVIGMTSLLQHSELNSEQRSYAEIIKASGESLLEIINEILDFSKIEANQIELEEAYFDLEQCLTDSLDIVSTLATQKKLELVLDLDCDSLVLARGDVQRVRQVLVNLLSNAIKFTESGEVILKVSARFTDNLRDLDNNSADAQGIVNFSVSDTGIGIPEATIEGLFDAFTQADSSTTRKFGGTGLGLSISKSLVNLMGGQIRVASKIGSGSTFSFDLPTQLRSLNITRNSEGLQEKRVHIVDDNQTNRVVLDGFLQKLGIQPKIYHDAESILADFDCATCDLVITDMAMPEMDGEQLATRLKQKYGSSCPPIMLLTSFDGIEVEKSLFANISHKPIRPSELLESIRTIFEDKNHHERKPVLDQLKPLNMEHHSVLIAEDNLVNQKVIRGILKKLQISADVAGNGQEVVDLLDQRHYDIILMDIQMPVLDGISATRKIRSKKNSKQPHIIAMTANAMKDDEEHCLESGMNDFVPKPITLKDVHQALGRATLN